MQIGFYTQGIKTDINAASGNALIESNNYTNQIVSSKIGTVKLSEEFSEENSNETNVLYVDSNFAVKLNGDSLSIPVIDSLFDSEYYTHDYIPSVSSVVEYINIKIQENIDSSDGTTTETKISNIRVIGSQSNDINGIYTYVSGSLDNFSAEWTNGIYYIIGQGTIGSWAICENNQIKQYDYDYFLNQSKYNCVGVGNNPYSTNGWSMRTQQGNIKVEATNDIIELHSSFFLRNIAYNESGTNYSWNGSELTITHNLNCQFPQVEIFITDGNGESLKYICTNIPWYINYGDTNSIIIDCSNYTDSLITVKIIS